MRTAASYNRDMNTIKYASTLAGAFLRAQEMITRYQLTAGREKMEVWIMHHEEPVARDCYLSVRLVDAATAGRIFLSPSNKVIIRMTFPEVARV